MDSLSEPICQSPLVAYTARVVTFYMFVVKLYNRNAESLDKKKKLIQIRSLTSTYKYIKSVGYGVNQLTFVFVWKKIKRKKELETRKRLHDVSEQETEDKL